MIFYEKLKNTLIKIIIKFVIANFDINNLK